MKEKYNAMPNQSVRIIYNHYSAEALYIFCKNTSAWGVVYRNLRSSDNTVFQKLRVSSGTWDANWVEPQYWALGEYGVTDIPKNADMHTYLTPGNYRMGSNTNATTLKNCPLSKAFTMKVYYGTGHPTDPEGYGYIIQDYLAFDGSREVRCNYHVFNNDWITYEVGITKI
ncbi:pyocin knob domain-containing protein [Lachnospiraceae bacterium 45-P1]